MRKLLAAGALAAATPLAAQLPPPATTVASVAARPALWKVSQGASTIYLFGTIHFLRPGINWLDGPVKRAFDESDTLELELVQPDAATMQALIAKTAARPEGPTLTERLPADRRAAFAAALTQAGMPAGALDRYRPWFAALTLTVVATVKAGYDPQNGPETVLTAAAAAAHRPVAGLETAAEQIGLMAGLPEKEQIAFLDEELAQMPMAKPLMDGMLAAWEAGQPDRLAALLNESMKDDPVLFDTLLTQRNRRWATWVEQRLHTPGTVFVAVGAGHLAGDRSVLAMLAKDGVVATRVQ